MPCPLPHLPNIFLASRKVAVCLVLLSAGRLSAAVDSPTLRWIQTALDAWQVACRSDLRITQPTLPWIIIHDEARAWHINPQRNILPRHTRTSQNVRFFGRTYEVLEVINNGSVWVPGREPVAVLPRTVTMLYADETKPFFMMGAPAFQERALRVNALDSVDFRNLLIGGVLHELTHTRQLPRVVPQIKQLQSKGKYPKSLDDNVIQRAFAGNDEFRGMYDEECEHFSAAVLARNPIMARAEAKKGLEVMGRRRQRFFVGEYDGWSEMEEVLLALEGSAMWVQFQSARRLAPRGQPWLETLDALGRRTDAWSQAEGLVLFLLIDRFGPGWQAQFFGSAVPSPSKVLSKAIDRTADRLRQ